MQKKNKKIEAENHIQEKTRAALVTEDHLEGDYLGDEVISSVSASNPWVVYDAGVIWLRVLGGTVEPNRNGIRLLHLRERFPPTKQMIFFRGQDIRRREWENFLGQDTFCYVFVRAWGIGRWKSQHKSAGKLNETNNFSEKTTTNGEPLAGNMAQLQA